MAFDGDRHCGLVGCKAIVGEGRAPRDPNSPSTTSVVNRLSNTRQGGAASRGAAYAQPDGL